MKDILFFVKELRPFLYMVFLINFITCRSHYSKLSNLYYKKGRLPSNNSFHFQKPERSLENSKKKCCYSYKYIE